MDWSDTPDQAAFRQEVKALVGEHLPELYRRMRDEGIEEGYEGGWIADRVSEDTERKGAAEAWTDAVSDRGWFAPHWPEEYGGAGLSPMEQFIYNQELAEAGAPIVGGSGVSLLGPTLIVHGTEDQKEKYLPKILSGEDRVGAGLLRARRGVGPRLVADPRGPRRRRVRHQRPEDLDVERALLRRDLRAGPHQPGRPEASRHLVPVDRRHPHAGAQPPAADQHGVASTGFNETFFEDVRTPAANVLGEVDRGWYVGMTLLDYERSNISGAVTLRRHIGQLIDFAHGRDADKVRMLLPSVRSEIADRYLGGGGRLQLLVPHHLDAERGGDPELRGVDGQDVSSRRTVLRLCRTGMKTFGLYANLWDGDDKYAPARTAFTQRYITSIPGTIGGGSSEIQRNIIATRGLGLPRG